MKSDELLAVPVPSFISILSAEEMVTGKPLTEEEVLEITGSAMSIALRESISDALDACRRYRDIDPEDCWAQWQQTRAELASGQFPVASEDLAPPVALERDVIALSEILRPSGTASKEVIENQLWLLAEDSARFLHKHGIL
jgi:hypothetical protein